MAPQNFPSTVASLPNSPTLVMLLPEDNTGWCQQFAEEGYNVIHVTYPPPSDSSASHEENLRAVQLLLSDTKISWALITYGFLADDAMTLTFLTRSKADLKACVHFNPMTVDPKSLLYNDTKWNYIPTTFHLASSQEMLHASLLPLTDPSSLPNTLSASSFFPITVYTYPMVSSDPPFPLLMKPPALLSAGEVLSVDPYLRSATGLAHTRTLELLKRNIGPHFDFEKLWEKHTYYEFIERDALKTMSTMVKTPYVNHVPTMTGGIGYEDLARFYKYHFTGINVTPPDAEMITVSRTVGADRIIDEMIFKFTHTTECDYFLPGIKPTGHPVEIALVGVVAFRGDKLTFEHIYWDQASLLVQIGLLDPTNLPVAGAQVGRKVLDPYGLPSNTLMTRWKESEGLPID